MPVHVKWVSQNCHGCGTKLISAAGGGLTGGVEIGSPLVVCPRCGKKSYTRMRTEWYNYPNKDLLWFILPVTALGLGVIIWNENGLPDILLGAAVAAIALGFGAAEWVRIAKSKRRMRDPEYLAELLRWRIIRQEEYEGFMRDAQKKG